MLHYLTLLILESENKNRKLSLKPFPMNFPYFCCAGITVGAVFVLCIYVSLALRTEAEDKQQNENIAPFDANFTDAQVKISSDCWSNSRMSHNTQMDIKEFLCVPINNSLRQHRSMLVCISKVQFTCQLVSPCTWHSIK